MKYCIDYRKHLKATEEADELVIQYSKDSVAILDFLAEHPDQRIIISVFQTELTKGDYNAFKAFFQAHKNISIRFDKITDDVIENSVEEGFPFFFGIFVNNWDTFLGLVELDVSDIYITEDLGFELDKVAEVAHKSDIKIRAFPNIAQSSWSDTPALKKFFIRPEDVDFYGNYIDVLEFVGEAEQMSTYLKIYKKDKKWSGKLNEIILDFNSDIDSRHIYPIFAEKRFNCAKKCQRGGKCAICDRVNELAKAMAERQSGFKLKTEIKK